MDLFIYLLVLVGIGLFHTLSPNSTVSHLLNDPGTQPADVYALPIGRNLQLLKETDAYTLILEELGLK